jgi:hypothetical protein
MEKLKNYLELFLQSCSYFSALYWVLKGFSKTPLFLLVISCFNSWLNFSPGPPVGPGPLVGPLAHLSAPAHLVEPVQVVQLLPTRPVYAFPLSFPLSRPLATESSSLSPRSIPTAPAGPSRRDGVRSIDLATAHLPIREILPIASRCPRLCRLLHLGFRPWRPRASPRAARPFP